MKQLFSNCACHGAVGIPLNRQAKAIGTCAPANSSNCLTNSSIMASSSNDGTPPVAVSSPRTASRVSRVSFSSASDAHAPLCGGGGFAPRRFGALGSGSPRPSPSTGPLAPDPDADAEASVPLLHGETDAESVICANT